MDQKYPMISVAVAAAIAGGYATTAAAQPTIGDAAGAADTLVIAGSSAAQSSIATAIEADLCGGTGYLAVQSNGATDPNKNFYAYSCKTAVTAGSVAAGTLVTIYYRSEGGSVTGALPIASEHTIKRLNLSDGTCAASGSVGTCTVTGVTSTNGPGDSWSGAVTPANVQLGVTDVEPGQLVNFDSPINSSAFGSAAYATSAFGTATNAQMQALNTSASRMFDQVFGIAVNPGNITNPNANGSINLSRESVAAILTGLYTDWIQVPDALTGASVSSTTPAPITVENREPGSGTRTASNIFFLNYGCSASATTAVKFTNGAPLWYSTGDEVAAAQGASGAIAYASIDKIIGVSGLTLATIDGQTASTKTAAAGGYGFWYEATFVPNTSTYLSGASLALANYLEADIPQLSKAPIALDVDVIPALQGNAGTVPLTSRGNTSATIYVNPFTRSKNSCAVPAQTNVQ